MLVRIRSGINLDQLTFREGNITYWNIWNIDRNANPHLYTESSIAADNNYNQPCHEDSENRVEEEEEEEEDHPLPIPDLSQTHSMTQESEQFSTKQSLENMNYELERHLGTIIEETFQERTMPESQ